MQPQLKTKWLAALRSGEYTQQRGSIGEGKHLCCIGVAGDVAGLQHLDWSTHETANKVGLHGKVVTTLIGMNDGDCASFSIIADWIEANIPAVD